MTLATFAKTAGHVDHLKPSMFVAKMGITMEEDGPVRKPQLMFGMRDCVDTTAR